MRKGQGEIERQTSFEVGDWPLYQANITEVTADMEKLSQTQQYFVVVLAILLSFSYGFYFFSSFKEDSSYLAPERTRTADLEDKEEGNSEATETRAC